MSPRRTRAPGDPGVLTAVGGALAAVRKAKSEAKVGMRVEVSAMTISAPDGVVAQAKSAEGDLRAAGRVTGGISYAQGEELSITNLRLDLPPA